MIAAPLLLSMGVTAAFVDAPTEPTGQVPIEWRAPPACPDARRCAITSRATWAPPEPMLRRGRAGDGALRGAGWRLELGRAQRRAWERRTLEDPDCALLSEAAGLVIALALDPIAVAATTGARTEEGSERAAAVAPERAAAPAAVVPAPPAVRAEPAVRVEASTRDRALREHRAPEPPRDRPAASSRPRGFVRVEALAGGGLMPGVGAGLGVAAGAHGRAWRVELGAEYWPPRETSVEAEPRARGRVRLAAGVVRGCLQLTARALRLSPCAGVVVGGFAGQGVGDFVVASRTEWSPWVGLSLAPAVIWTPLRWLGLLLALEGVVSATLPEFHIDGAGQLHRVGRVGGRLRLGLELQFP
ncbi:MAG: hypothetical protein R3A51_18060 [Nannocystaceae bacterium]